MIMGLLMSNHHLTKFIGYTVLVIEIITMIIGPLEPLAKFMTHISSRNVRYSIPTMDC